MTDGHGTRIQVSTYGGPEVLEMVTVATTEPGPQEALVSVTTAGVNFMDVATREGDNPTVEVLPTTLGVEGAGTIEQLGSAIVDLRVGQRVAWYYVPGSYAEYLVAPAAALVPVPDDISDDTAASLLMQGLTAQHLAEYATSGDTAVVHAAAGGVGSLLTQLLAGNDVTVIARVSSRAKAAVAVDAGAQHVLIGRGSGFADEVFALTGGTGVDLVYDGAGAESYEDSLAVLRTRGIYAYYGGADEEPDPIRLSTLPRSVLLTRPVVMNHVASRAELLRRTSELFTAVRAGRLSHRVSQTFALENAGDAHRALEGRASTGKLLLHTRHHV